MRRLLPLPGSPDSGASLVAAVGAGVIGLSLTIVMTTMVIVTQQDSGVDRKRAVAVSAAEAGVDAAYAAILSAGPEPPCRWPLAGSVDAVGSDATQIVSTITYYRADNTVIPCGAGNTIASTEQAAKAQILSTADASGGSSQVGAKGKRTMEAEVNLTPNFANAMTDAIFSNSTLTFANNSRVYGHSGPDANVYSNNSIFCQNGNSNTQFDGTFMSQGSVTLSNQCHITGDLWVAGNVALNNNKVAIGGYVRSSGGTVSAVPEGATPMVGKLVQARSPGPGQNLGDMINWDTCWTNSGRSTLRDPARCQWLSSVPAPPTKPFPIIRGDAAALGKWQAGGYTVIKDTDPGMDPTCNNPDSGGMNWVSNWIVAHAPTLAGKTLLSVECPNTIVRFQNMGNQKVQLGNDLAVFARSGFVTSGNTTFRSNDADQHVFHVIVPFDATSNPYVCNAPTISLDNQTSIEPSLVTMLYTPCASAIANNSTFTGQIYGGGSMSVNNQFVMQFTQVPMPDGTVEALSTIIEDYSVDVAFKRETRNP